MNKPTLTDGGKFKRYYSPMMDSLQFDRVEEKQEKPTKQEADSRYFAYMESTTELQAVRIKSLESALTTALIKLNKFDVALQMDIEPKRVPKDEYLSLLATLKNRIDVR
jgi:glutamate/tyrosine decarboxylase-like PLP-dependent enzyme